MGLLSRAERVLELRYLKRTGELMCEKFKEMDDPIHGEIMNPPREYYGGIRYE